MLPGNCTSRHPLVANAVCGVAENGYVVGVNSQLFYMGDLVRHLDGELKRGWYICRPFIASGVHGQLFESAVYFMRVEQRGIIVQTTFIPVNNRDGLLFAWYYNAAGANSMDASFLHQIDLRFLVL